LAFAIQKPYPIPENGGFPNILSPYSQAGNTMALDTEASRWTVLTIANIPVYLGLGSIFFGDWSGFFECLRFWFTPDWVSLCNGEYFEDRWAETKLFLFAAICLLAIYGEYKFFFGEPFKAKQIISCLTPGSTRTQPARSACMSHVLDFSSSFIIRPPVGPVNLFR
jgi:outer membrane protein assembly factor BamB